MFRGLTFESEAETFRKAGVRVGADARDAERALLEGVLDPFDLTMRNQALRMSRLYALVFCFENSVRELIEERLVAKHGVDWWEKGVPESVRKMADSRQKTALKDSWLEGDKKSQLGFVDFGSLANIICNSWDDFADLGFTQQWLRQRMEELEKARNFIAHNRFLLPSEFRRIEMYIKDWEKTVGF